MGEKKIAVITIHGIGKTKFNYACDIKARLSKQVNSMGRNWEDDVTFHSVYYQGILHKNQKRYMRVARKTIGRNFWNCCVRPFLIHSLGDAGTLEASRTLPNGAYEKTQEIIFEVLKKARAELESSDCPVIFIAQSLGGQVLSNYIWDADKWYKTNLPKCRGYWSNKNISALEINKNDLNFMRLETLKVLITTGCNIPIFLCGLPPNQIIPIQRGSNGLIWENYYSKNDVLGWPLKDLSKPKHFIGTKPRTWSYCEVVNEDIKIGVGNILTRWNPFSHKYYWKDEKIIKAIAEHIYNHIHP